MATTLPWGETLTVTMTLGYLVRKFTLDTSLLDGTDVLDGTLDGVFVEGFVQSISIVRGRKQQLSNFTAGTCQITLLNDDRRFDPINQDSPYWDVALDQTGVVPRRNVTVTSGSTVIFYGTITDIDVSYERTVTNRSTVTISAADDFVLLANAFIGDAFTPTAELSGARVARILDLPAVNYSATRRTISTGVATLGAYEISSSSNVLSYLQDCATAEQNYCFMSADGYFIFSDRVAAAFNTAAVSFSDVSGGGVQYTTLSVVYGQELLYNRVQCTTVAVGATVQISDGVTSQTQYGISTLALDTLLLSDDAAAATLAVSLLARYKDPVYRFDQMDVAINGLSALNRNAVVGLDLSDTIGITRTFSTGSPSSVTQLYNIDGISHTYTLNSHAMSFQLAVADTVYALILDDAVFGVLDADNALG